MQLEQLHEAILFMYKNITNEQDFHVPTIAEYKKKNFEIHTAVFPRFMSDIVSEFKDFANIGT